MIKIVGRITNAVDCGCYEIQAVPAPAPEHEELCCEEPLSTRAPEKKIPRFRVDAKRGFVIEVDDAQRQEWFDGKPPRFYFLVYQDGDLKLSTARSVYWPLPKRQRELVIDLCRKAPPPPCGKVCGVVTDCRGNPLAGMRVRVYDVDLYDAIPLTTNAPVALDAEKRPRPRKPGTPLGAGVTNECGEYCICYKREDYAQDDIDTADIRIVVGPREGAFRALQVSDIQFNAPASLTVDLAVPGSELDGSGEFIEYHRKLSRLGCNTPDERSDLTDDQIDFVSNEAGILIDHLLLLRLAYQIDRVFLRPLGSFPDHILPQILYGLLRLGVTGLFPTWARRYPEPSWNLARIGDKLGSLLDSAIESCVIDRGLGFFGGRADTKGAGLLIWAFSFVYALTTPLLPNRSSWLELFTVAFPWPANASKFLKFGLAWLRFGVGKPLWDELAPPIFSTGDLDKLKKLVKWAEISGFWAPAVALFNGNEAALVAAAEPNGNWAGYFTLSSLGSAPAGIAFADYSQEVLERARASLGRDAVATWLAAANTGTFPGLTLTAAQAQASAVRLSRLAPSAAFAGRLAQYGFTSARDIASLRWDDFRRTLGEPATSVQALYTYTKARETRAVATAATLQLAPMLNTPLAFLGQPNFAGTTLAGGVADTLFGSGSACDCEGRQSVFSPAAYLHALRRFLANILGPAGAPPNARDLFDLRRPDVKDLKLSYVNTYTVLPTIDLNNEVLEDLAAAVLDPTALLIPPLANRQTTREASELELVYEYENIAVYDEFLNPVWPWRFPFDLNHAKRRIFLDAAGLAREDILRLVSVHPPIDDLSNATLDLTDAERLEITTPAPALSAPDDPTLPLPDYGNATLGTLMDPTAMMDRAQLGFQDLYAITQLSAIYADLATGAPRINPVVDGSAKDPCNPSAYTLNKALVRTESMTEAQADRIRRFLRLRRALPWPMHILDWAVGAFVNRGQPLFPLEWLGTAELIRGRLKLKPHEVVAFWTPLSTARWEMPFVKTKAIPSPWEQVFNVRSAGTLTVAAAARLSGISQQFALELEPGVGSTVALDVDIASRFFRYGRLAKAIPGLRPEDIKKYKDLTGPDVFGSPADTWNAIGDFEAVRRSGARLSAALPFYFPQTDPRAIVQRRQMLTAIEDLNRRARLPDSAPFETALARFVPEATVSVVAQKLSAYDAAGVTAAEMADLDSALAELLSLPRLLAPQPLSAEPDRASRGARILEASSRRLWDSEMPGLLARASGLDPATARLIAENVRTFSTSTTSPGNTLVDEFKGLLGDGAWPTATVLGPDAQETFLDAGLLVVPPAAAAATLTAEFKAQILVGDPGPYEIRAKAAYAATASSQVLIGTQPIAPDEVVVIQSFTVPETGLEVSQDVLFTLTTDTACSLSLELVEPSGSARPLPGTRLYSDDTVRTPIDGATEALELMALSGALATQWKLGADDLAALVRLQSGNASFPNFPPRDQARPLTGQDGLGFTAWLEYARLVAALKMTRGEGRRVLYETALLAQSGGTADAWPGVAVALELERDCVEEAGNKLRLATADFAKGIAWLKLFDLSRALAEHGVSAAETFAAWGSTLPATNSAADRAASGAVVASLEGAVRARLAQTRSGTDKLREAVDKIRALKRDVLCDFLLAHPRGGNPWLTRTDISDYLLTDVEMQSCAQTSRIRFAIAAAQRLVTQALAQAEPQMSMTAEQENEWRSISQYRLWEVRLRILTYAESWLKFGRHLHKSPEFEELERSLLQGDLAEEKAHEALTRYVEQLHGVGHLEIVGTCAQQEVDATGALSLDLLHVVGRTPAEPRAYYHRTRVDGAYWTPWRKIELDIDCDQIVPVVNNRQLHLFWLVPETTAQKTSDVKKDDRQIALDDKYTTLRLAWSVLTSKGWRAKMISKTALSTRFGHYAANRTSARGTSSPYAEVQAWNQAVQDMGTYQLRPTLSDEGDVVIEVYGFLESTVVSKVEKGIPDWVYEVRRTLDNFGIGAAWFAAVDADATASLNGLVNDLRANVDARLRLASPLRPAITPSGARTAGSTGNRLLGTFKLTPDNLVEVGQRSAEFETRPAYLAAAERMRTLPGIGNAVSRSGAFEFDDGSVELHAGGAYRTMLASAGTPVRVVVTRQEPAPSERDPVFCRVKNRAFFAFKEPDPLPPALVALDKDRQTLANPFQTSPREHVDRAVANASALAPAMVARVGYGAMMAGRFAVSLANSAVASAGNVWRFALAHHPQTIELLRAVKAGLDRLYTRETQSDSRAATGSLSVPFRFAPDYAPVQPWVDVVHLPADELEFKPDQAYAVQNWELLYHAPLMIGQQLMRVGRYDDARGWVARVFNPRDPAVLDAAGTVAFPENYWVFKPFVDSVRTHGVSDFQNLDPNPPVGTDLLQLNYLRRVFRALIKQWRANPFNPHAVAAFRPQAYQLAALFLYVENMIAAGDYFFAAPSAELVELAARHYEEAERVIGRSPVSTGAIRYDAPAVTVQQLETGAFPDPALGGADLENTLSVGDGPSPQVEDAFLPDLALGYFCLPPNPKIKELRDKIQDRLFKVHYCLDLLGNPRKLPLYDPPIDPALLADAAMAGLNVSQAVMDAYTPRPHYRFRTLLGLAKGLGQHVTSLGAGLLSAMEKRDAESLSLLKTTHEAKVLERVSAVRRLQVEDAAASINALEGTLRSVEFRREYYSSREFMNAEESAQIVLSLASTIFRTIGQSLNAAASAAGAVPDITIGVAGMMGSPVTITKTGGENFSRVPAGLGTAMSAVGDFMGTFSSIAASMGSFRRRKDDWDFQADAAALEAKQINAQILGAKIRQTIAERELANHEAQLEQSREELDFVRTKQTSVSLYEWLAADIGASYYRAFQLAHSMALQAQRALQDELGSNQRYIGYSHWDGGRNGLHAGERLMQELLDMESQYHGQNARPVVKTMNVSLAQVDPIALAELKRNGSCTFDLTEAYWDRYAPGLYFRRFATVSLSVPAVVGPFGGVHGRLSLRSAHYRKDPSLLDADGDGTPETYARQPSDDTRLVDQFPRPGDFIVLSTGVRDTGLGGDEQREDRYRPFENLGVDSAWQLEISQRDNTFDLATIADVVLHVEYTARDGGQSLANKAREALATSTAGEGFLVSLRHQYAGQWQAFRSGVAVELDLKPQFSGWASNRDERQLDSLEVALLLRVKAQPEDPNARAVLTLGPPSAPSDPSGGSGAATDDTVAFDDFDVDFAPHDDGGSRFGMSLPMSPQPVDDGAGGQRAPVVLFGRLRGTWTLAWAQASAIAPEDLEDAVVSVKWGLNGSA